MGGTCLFHHLHRNEHLVTPSDRTVKTASECEIYAKLIPWVVMMIGSHLFSECAVSDIIRIYNSGINSGIESPDNAGGAVVFEVVITILAVFGFSLFPENIQETRCFRLGEV